MGKRTEAAPLETMVRGLHGEWLSIYIYLGQ